MERYYDVPFDSDSLMMLEDEIIKTPNGRIVPRKPRLPDLSIKAALMLRNDLARTIPREEVEEMCQVVMDELGKIKPGGVSTIVGG